MTARELMSTPVATVRAESSLDEVAHLLTRRKIADLPVVDSENRLVGLVTESDVFRALALRLGVGLSPTAHLNPTRLPATVRDVMHRSVPTVKPTDGVVHCLVLMVGHDGHTVVVVDKGKVVGVISRRDALGAIAPDPAAPDRGEADELLAGASANADKRVGATP